MTIQKTDNSTHRFSKHRVRRFRFITLFSSLLVISLFHNCGSPPSFIIEPDPESRLLWRFQTNEVVKCSPAITSDGAIIFTSGGDLYALQSNGTLIWRIEASIGTGYYSSPTIGDDGTIYIGSRNGQLTAISPDGEQIWVFDTAESFTSSAAIGADGTIYYSARGTVYAISSTGELIWSYSRYLNFGSPVIGADGTIYVTAGDRDLFMGSPTPVLYTFSPDGSVKWNYFGVDGAPPPAIGSDGTIYITSGDSCLHALMPNGQLKWKFHANSKMISGPSIGLDGSIYFGSWNNRLYAVQPDGSMKWEYQTDGRLHGTPTIGSDGTIYVTSLDSTLYAIDNTGSLLWRYQTDGPIATSGSALSDWGILYTGSNGGYLYALGTDSPMLADTPWPKYQANNQNTGRR